MTLDIDNVLAPYDYPVPQHLIATSPAHPRDSAKLLIYDRKTNRTSFDTFHNITTYLPKNAALVFNQTKVIPARIHLTKSTGGIIEALYLGNTSNTIRVLASGKIAPGDTLTLKDDHTFTVKSRDGKYALLQPSFHIADLYCLLEQYGETPLPPYIKDSPLSESERRTEYQTVYAKTEGSVAAPTAGLHFTPELLKKIEDYGCSIAYVTLHVNIGTFAPLTDEHLKQKKLHEEYYEIDETTALFLNKAKEEGRPIIAVGTTSVRTLESAAQARDLVVRACGRMPLQRTAVPSQRPILQHLNGITDIFITEHDPLHFVDGLITNFHIPKSSLLMLASAFTGREKLLDLYKQAIKKEFRFFSFGDGMMITAILPSDQYSPPL